MKVLLTSVGRRGYLVKYFKQDLDSEGEVWGADSSQYTPAFKYCDKTAILPEVSESDYIDNIISLCKNNKIDIVIPLIDPELQVLSQQRQKFYDNGILVVVSPIKTIQISFDKYLTYQFARDNGIAAPKSFIDIELTLQSISKGQMSWPLLVKPRKGSASLGILLCQNEKQLRLAFESSTFPMIQQHIKGDEYGYDVFCDFDFRPISVFCGPAKPTRQSAQTTKTSSISV